MDAWQSAGSRGGHELPDGIAAERLPFVHPGDAPMQDVYSSEALL